MFSQTSGASWAGPPRFFGVMREQAITTAHRCLTAEGRFGVRWPDFAKALRRASNRLAPTARSRATPLLKGGDKPPCGAAPPRQPWQPRSEPASQRVPPRPKRACRHEEKAVSRPRRACHRTPKALRAIDGGDGRGRLVRISTPRSLKRVGPLSGSGFSGLRERSTTRTKDEDD